MATTISPNMNLVIPTVGSEAGPQFALDINSSLTIVDGHNHTSGLGVQIPSAGLNINSDLPFNNNNLTLARSVRFSSQPSPLALVTDLGCLYESGVDLYYNDGNGNQIRITQSGNIVGSAGSITGLVSPASATYVSGNQTFVWQSAANTPANLDAASILLRNLVANSKALTLQPPGAMGSNYSLTLPSLPSSASFVTMDTSGNITGSISLNGGITNSNIMAGTITGTTLSPGTITNLEIAPLTILGTNIASGTISGDKIGTNVSLAGDSVTANNLFVVVGIFEGVHGLGILRGSFDSSGTITYGEGFSVSHPSTGVYTITFTHHFGDNPSVSANTTTDSAGELVITVSGVSSSGCTLNCRQWTTGNFVNQNVSFMAMGLT